jgi:phosphatidylserine decarboxylase
MGISIKDAGFIALQYLLPHHTLSRLVGRIANSRTPWVKDTFIQWFSRRYRVDMNEALEPDLAAYPTFNAFFTRALRPDARPADPAAHVIVSPADGAVSQAGPITANGIFQAKGQYFSTLELLGGDQATADLFDQGSFATIYLAPRDYHRVHMPCAGTLRRTAYLPGRLFSVNQLTAGHVPRLFARNERLVCLFDTEFGPMAMILVGAMIVAGIETVWAGHAEPSAAAALYARPPTGTVQLDKAAEMGRFKLGSTVILLYGKDAVRWSETVVAGLPLRMGQSIAERGSRS